MISILVILILCLTYSVGVLYGLKSLDSLHNSYKEIINYKW